MPNLYQRYILAWERRLNSVDPDRRITPFNLGQEWLENVPAEGASFFEAPPVRNYELHNGALSFRSAVETPYVENEYVHARWYPASGNRAVVVIAQWNSDEQGHLGLCRIFQAAGISALRVSMPYHDVRMPRDIKRAEYTVDSNLGRTIHAARQAVIDIRSSLDWLESLGHTRLGIVGTSLGSCYALLASAHDARLRVNAFNHISQYFGDVVWTGLATAHVRKSLEPYITQDELRHAWRLISPATYMDQFQRMSAAAPKKNLLIWARYDPCFLPEFSRNVVAEFRARGLDHEAHCLACGHYTIGRWPFKYMDAWLITRFLRREL